MGGGENHGSNASDGTAAYMHTPVPWRERGERERGREREKERERERERERGRWGEREREKIATIAVRHQRALRSRLRAANARRRAPTTRASREKMLEGT